MRIALGNDHAGCDLKAVVCGVLPQKGKLR